MYVSRDVLLVQVLFFSGEKTLGEICLFTVTEWSNQSNCKLQVYYMSTKN